MKIEKSGIQCCSNWRVMSCFHRDLCFLETCFDLVIVSCSVTVIQLLILLKTWNLLFFFACIEGCSVHKSI